MRFPSRPHPLRATKWLIALLAITRIALVSEAAAGDRHIPTGVSLGGTTGLVNTPTADVMPDRTFHAGAAVVDRKWAYVERGQMDNEIYFFTVGFLPRLEVSIRATVFPDIPLLEGQGTPVVDRMASARLQVLRGGRGPAVAVGVDDVRGTRLFHSLYIVGTQAIPLLDRADLKGSLGWGSTALTATTHVLDGVFGGFELTLWKRASLMIDLDTEKVNSGFRLTAFDRLGIHIALLNLETPSGGLGWTQIF